MRETLWTFGFPGDMQLNVDTDLQLVSGSLKLQQTINND